MPHDKFRAQANWRRAINMVLNNNKYNTLKPGNGVLGLAGTRGGTKESLTKYMKQVADHHGEFPYRWRIADNDFLNLVNGNKVTARSVVDSQPNLVPIMWVPFVMLQEDEIFIGPVLRIGGNMTVNHAHIARLSRKVLFAGQLNFGRLGNSKGKLLAWNADSGGYRCNDNQAEATGLPMGKYESIA